MSALEDRLRRFAYEWHEAMNSPYAVNMMPLLLEVASDVRSLAASSLEAENAKLRDSLKALMMGTNTELCADRDEPDCKECSMHHGKDGCIVVDAMELLGIDMYGEPLEVKS